MNSDVDKYYKKVTCFDGDHSLESRIKFDRNDMIFISQFTNQKSLFLELKDIDRILSIKFSEDYYSYSKSGEELSQIVKFTDEWYYIIYNPQNPSDTEAFKCDQLSGLMSNLFEIGLKRVSKTKNFQMSLPYFDKNRLYSYPNF